MKNLIVSISVGLLSGFTVYLLIDYLFERPSKSVKATPGVAPEDPEDTFDVYEDDDFDPPIPLEPEKVVKEN